MRAKAIPRQKPAAPFGYCNQRVNHRNWASPTARGANPISVAIKSRFPRLRRFGDRSIASMSPCRVHRSNRIVQPVVYLTHRAGIRPAAAKLDLGNDSPRSCGRTLDPVCSLRGLRWIRGPLLRAARDRPCGRRDCPARRSTRAPIWEIGTVGPRGHLCIAVLEPWMGDSGCTNLYSLPVFPRSVARAAGRRKESRSPIPSEARGTSVRGPESFWSAPAGAPTAPGVYRPPAQRSPIRPSLAAWRPVRRNQPRRPARTRTT